MTVPAVIQGCAEVCQGCRARVEVDQKGRVAAHNVHEATFGSARGRRWLVSAAVVCSRSGHPSIDELLRRKARRREVTIRQILDLRDEALVALDAFLEGREELADRIPEMRRVATHGHRRLVRRQGRRTVHVDREGETSVITARCVFCDDLLVKLPEWPSSLAAIEHMDEVYRHATECALRFLATYQGDAP